MVISRSTLSTFLILLLSSIGVLVSYTNISQAAPRVSVSVDPQIGSIGDHFQLRVKVQDPEDTNLPTLDNNGDFKVRFLGVSQSHRITGMNVERYAEYIYQLTPTREGNLKTPTPSILTRSGTLTGQSLEVPISNLPMAKTAPTEKLSLSHSIQTPPPYFVGQQIQYSVEILSQVNIFEPRLDASSFPGFFTEELKDRPITSRWINGQNYTVTTINRVLFPNKSGTIEISPRELTGKVLQDGPGSGVTSPFDPFGGNFFGGFFRQQEYQDVSVKTDKLIVEVAPLPSPTPIVRPIIGETSIQISPKIREISFGETAKFEVEVLSSGRLATLKSLNLAPPPTLKLYERSESPVFHEGSGSPYYSRRFTLSYVPLQGGDFFLDPISLQIFNPQTNSYAQASSLPYSIKVSGGPAEAPPTPTSAVKLSTTPQPRSQNKQPETNYWEPSKLRVQFNRMTSDLLVQVILVLVIVVFGLLGWFNVRRKKKGREITELKLVPGNIREVEEQVLKILARFLNVDKSEIYLTNIENLKCTQMHRIKVAQILEEISELKIRAPDTALSEYEIQNLEQILAKNLKV